MGIVVDILVVLFIVLGAIAGAKRGLIKSLVGLIGLVAILIISFSLKTPIANFLIDKLPFLTFGGNLAGLSTINILFYNIISFVVVFIVLYCLLSIIIKITGFVDTLLKLTVIWIIPSKIGGAIIGLFESWVYVYLVLFVLLQFSITYPLVDNSNVGKFVLDHTPIVGTYLKDVKDGAFKIYKSIDEYTKDESKTTEDLDLLILQSEINSGLITKAKANELIQTGKINLEGVQIAIKELSKWLNI